jgi:hypothetical protein
VGADYAVYVQRNPEGLTAFFEALWTDRNERTAAHFSITKLLSHFLVFPFRFLYEIVPWSILIFAMVRKGLPAAFKQNDLLRYASLILLVNISIYWISPGSNSRYLIMFFPLAITILMWFYGKQEFVLPKRNAVIHWIYGTILYAGAIGIWYFMVDDTFEIISERLLWSIGLSVGFTVLGIAYINIKTARLLIMVSGVLLGRIAYNGMVRPMLDVTVKETAYREGAERIAKNSKGSRLFLWKDTEIVPEITVYISRVREEILRRERKEAQPGTDYLMQKRQLTRLQTEEVGIEIIDQFPSAPNDTLYQIRFIHPNS